MVGEFYALPHRPRPPPQPVPPNTRSLPCARTSRDRAAGALLVPEAGFEPACPFGQSVLSRSCQPLQHSGRRRSVYQRGVSSPTRKNASTKHFHSSPTEGTSCRFRASRASRALPLREWSFGRVPKRQHDPQGRRATCAICAGQPCDLPPGSYGYLLGLYLGDGWISEHQKHVYRLRIVCCDAYPDLMDECELVMSEILPNKVGRVQRIGCTEVVSYSKHWPHLFPQHGPGPNHRRPIVLVDWQRQIVDRFPAPFVRGLLHSDGCRVLNRVNNTDYPRYHFTNVSDDIRALFGRACDLLGVDWRPNNRTNLSVARRPSVQILDQFVGPKH